MEETILIATNRDEKPNITRKLGYIPGVLNGPGTASTSVKFQNLALNKIISKHGSNAKIWIELGSEKKFGYIKEIQRNPVEGKVIHVAIQLVAADQEVKMFLPIVFHGHGELKNKLLNLQVYKTDIEVFGVTVFMPDVAVVDVTSKKVGENVTAIDFHLPAEIKIIDAEDEVYAVVKGIREEVVEEVAEVAK